MEDFLSLRSYARNFADAYANARVIVDLGGGQSSGAGPTPEPPKPPGK